MTLGLLHPGERVLNARENREYEGQHGSAGQQSVAINNVFNISTPDADSFRHSRTQILNRERRALSRRG